MHQFDSMNECPGAWERYEALCRHLDNLYSDNSEAANREKTLRARKFPKLRQRRKKQADSEQMTLFGLACRSAILDILAVSPEPISARAVRDHLRKTQIPGWSDRKVISPPYVRQLLKKLERSGDIVSRQSGKILLYRTRLNLEPGTIVVEMPGTPSERYGWVEEMRQLTKGVFPLVRWMNGTRSFSSDDLLERCQNPLVRQRVKAEQRMAAGDIPDGFKPIPWELLDGIVNSGGRLHQKGLMAIAKHLGIFDNSNREASRTQVIDYLDLWYPGWRDRNFAGRGVA